MPGISMQCVPLSKVQADIDGWVSVSYCPGSDQFIKQYGPKEISRFVYRTRHEAFHAKASIDEYGCGGGCRGWHCVEQAYAGERVGTYWIPRKSYEKKFQGAFRIPKAYRLPGEKSRSDKYVAKKNVQKAVQKNAQTQHNPSFRFLILRRDNYRCRLCGVASRDGDHVRLEVDHITPRSQGGSDDMSNLWTLCFACNRGKGANML